MSNIGNTDEQISKFAEAIVKGAIVYCSPSIYNAIMANSEHVAKFGGCEIRASSWCVSDTLYAVTKRRDEPGYDFRELYNDPDLWRATPGRIFKAPIE